LYQGKGTNQVGGGRTEKTSNGSRKRKKKELSKKNVGTLGGHTNRQKKKGEGKILVNKKGIGTGPADALGVAQGEKQEPVVCCARLARENLVAETT